MTLRFLIFLLCTTKKIYNHESIRVLDRHTFLNSIKMLCVPSFLLAVSVSWYQSTGVRFALLSKMWPCFCFLLPPYMKFPHFIYLSSSGYDLIVLIFMQCKCFGRNESSFPLYFFKMHLKSDWSLSSNVAKGICQLLDKRLLSTSKFKILISQFIATYFLSHSLGGLYSHQSIQLSETCLWSYSASETSCKYNKRIPNFLSIKKFSFLLF